MTRILVDKETGEEFDTVVPAGYRPIDPLKFHSGDFVTLYKREPEPKELEELITDHLKEYYKDEGLDTNLVSKRWVKFHANVIKTAVAEALRQADRRYFRK